MAGSKPADPVSCTETAGQDRVGVVRLIMGKPAQSPSIPPSDTSTEQPGPAVVAAVSAPAPTASVIHRPDFAMPVWPFVLADVMLVIAAVALMIVAPRPLNPWVCGGAVTLVLCGAGMALLPLLFEARTRHPVPNPPQRRFQNQLPINPA